jgi:peptidoglycan hydrolase CwlO-like protein
MIKKLVIGGILFAMLASVVTFGGRPFSYARTWIANWKQNAEDNVPLDLKIQHARKEVEKLGPDIRKSMHAIAGQQVDAENLQERIAKRRKAIKRHEQVLLRMRNDLKRGETSYVYAGHTYLASEVRRDLALRFDRFRTAEESLKRDSKILAAKHESLKANERRLEEMLASKKQLEVQIEQLEARHKTLQAAEATSELEFDDTHLARTKTLIKKIAKELDVRDKLMASEGRLRGLIPVDEKPTEIPVINITKEVDEYFAKRSGNGVTIVRNNGAATAAKPGAGL